ncbi:hypothetical protein Tco_0568851 [Tanacetum coccineum]
MDELGNCSNYRGMSLAVLGHEPAVTRSIEFRASRPEVTDSVFRLMKAAISDTAVAEANAGGQLDQWFERKETVFLHKYCTVENQSDVCQPCTIMGTALTHGGGNSLARTVTNDVAGYAMTWSI